MYTIITRNIDGYEIITGLGMAVIDPVSTKNEIKKIIDDSEELKAVNSISCQLNTVRRAYSAAINQYMTFRERNDLKRMSAAEAEFELKEKQINELISEFKASVKILDAKKISVWNENIIYFQPKAGEKIVSEADYKRILIRLSETQGKRVLLSSDEKEIPDHRNVQYVKNEKIVTIKKLGEVPDGKTVSEYSADQVEIFRVNTLSETEKKEEFSRYESAIMNESVSMKAMLEIKNDKESLKKSQDFYNNEIQKLTKKYGIVN